MKRLGRNGWLALALVGGLLAGVPPAGSAEKLTFSIGWVPYGLHGGFFGALGEGFYRKAGLDVQWQRGYGAPDTAKRIAVGQFPLGISDVSNVALGRARKLEIKSVAQLLTFSPHAILTFRDSGIRHPKDLTGRIVSTAPGAIVDQTFPVFAEMLGIKVGKWIYVEPRSMNATLLSGKADALLAFGIYHPILNQMAQKTGKEVQAIWWSDYGFEMLGESVVTTDKLIRDNPDLVRRFVRATLEGYAWSIEHPAEAARHLVNAVPTAKANIEEQQWKVTIGRILAPGILEKGLGHHDFKRVAVTRDLVFKVNGIRENIPVEEIATNALLPPGPILPKR
ncbi:MAG: ABC transporter substrate-binding protein [Candidatus Tectomicrobia bacterium]|nr:ABC transporter substrate-binding protein [Candidatus Tectomicrobia bacterium]